MIPYVYSWIWMKNLNPDHSTQWFCTFQLNLDEQHEFWSLHTVIPYISSLIWMRKMDPDHSTRWFRTFSAEFEWNRWILITPLSDSVYLRLNLDEKHESWLLHSEIPYISSLIWRKKVNPGHPTKWFRIFSAWLSEKHESWLLHIVIPYNFA